MKPQTTPVTAVVGFVCYCFAGDCSAGDAVFSKDGKRIYGVANVGQQAAVQEIDLSKNTIRTIPLTQLSSSDWLRGITCSSENKLFCTTKGSLWSLDAQSGKLMKIRDAPMGANFWRIAYDAKSRRTFVTTDDEEHPLFMFKEESEWIPVRMRRHPYPSCLVFASTGELFFAAYGDLWHGEIQSDEGNYFSLAAYRYAPLATLESANTTPTEIGVSDIAVTRDSVYVKSSRMGGSGEGWFGRLTRPRAKRNEYGEMDLHYEPKDRLALYQKSLKSLQILSEDFRAGNLCASPDESRLYYFLDRKHWLATNGKPEELHLREQ